MEMPYQETVLAKILSIGDRFGNFSYLDPMKYKNISMSGRIFRANSESAKIIGREINNAYRNKLLDKYENGRYDLSLYESMIRIV